MMRDRDRKEMLLRKRKYRSRFVFSLNLAPMMDVMFNLLIFFLVGTSFMMPEGLLEAKLPRTTGISSDQSSAIPVVPIKIFLETGGIGKPTLIRVSTTLRTDAASLTVVENFDELHTFLKELHGRPGITADTPVIIAAKPATVWDQVVNAYNAALRARYKNIVFAGY